MSLANVLRAAFLETPNRRAIALIGIISARRSRPISAQSSTLITLHRVTEGVRFHPSLTPGGSRPVGLRLIAATGA